MTELKGWILVMHSICESTQHGKDLIMHDDLKTRRSRIMAVLQNHVKLVCRPAQSCTDPPPPTHLPSGVRQDPEQHQRPRQERHRGSIGRGGGSSSFFLFSGGVEGRRRGRPPRGGHRHQSLQHVSRRLHDLGEQRGRRGGLHLGERPQEARRLGERGGSTREGF